MLPYLIPGRLDFGRFLRRGSYFSKGADFHLILAAGFPLIRLGFTSFHMAGSHARLMKNILTEEGRSRLFNPISLCEAHRVGNGRPR
jgi:hypothetical protein